MDNHYVSQLITKRFNKKINIYNFEVKASKNNVSPKSIFFDKDIYDDDIEIDLGKIIEDPFAKLVDNKILKFDKDIKLSRFEIMQIKQFLLLYSIRTLSYDEYFQLMISFTSNADRYQKINSAMHPNDVKNFISIKKLNLTKKEIFMRAMRLYIDCATIKEMETHEFVTKESYFWAKVFLDSYLKIWQASDEEDFVLSDNGMVSEYEACHKTYGGLDLSKYSYLYYNMLEAKDRSKKFLYADLLSKQTIMYENFNIFNLSYNISLVLINPYFRLLSEKSFKNKEGFINMEVSKYNPSAMYNLKLFEVAKTEYVFDGIFTSEDLFTYNPVKLDQYQTVYLNNLFIENTKKYVGYKDPKKIVNSIFYSLLSSQEINTTQEIKHNIKNFAIYTEAYFNNLEKNKFKDFMIYLRKQGILANLDFEECFEKWIREYMRDLRENPYIYKYLLSNKEKMRFMTNFDFLGTYKQRLDFFENRLKEIERGW